MPEFVTPYQMMNYRNYIHETLAYFVIVARTENDVSKAVQFAAKHKLALSVFSTGHEFQDRNAGMAPNGLLIRTLCLRNVEVDLDPSNKFGHSDGVVKMGSGWTWGPSRFGMKAAHEVAKEHGRIVVSGSAGEVGIVGWSMGGGHSPLGPW